MTHMHTNKTAQTENVSNGEVILKGWISGQKQTRLCMCVKQTRLCMCVSLRSRPALSNPKCLLRQKLCHYLNQGRKLNDILMRAANLMAYFYLNKLSLA